MTIMMLGNIGYTLMERCNFYGRVCSGDYIKKTTKASDISKFYLKTQGRFLYWMIIFQSFTCLFATCCYLFVIPAYIHKITHPDNNEKEKKDDHGHHHRKGNSEIALDQSEVTDDNYNRINNEGGQYERKFTGSDDYTRYY